MKKNLHLVSVIIIVLSIITITLINYYNNPSYEGLLNLAYGLIVTFISIIIIDITNSITFLRFIYLTKWKYRKEVIRISFSYLYKIKINDNYLLVPNSTYKNYQPVGGVYKYYSGAQSIFDKLDVTDDDELKTTGKAKDDLRKLIPAPNLLAFIKWFESGKDREIHYSREFKEELIDTGFLNLEDFSNVKARLSKRIKTPIHMGDMIKHLQFLIYDIIEVEFTEEQQNILENLEDNTSSLEKNIKWASDELIEKSGVRNKEVLYNIARHTQIMKTKNWVKPGGNKK